MTHPSEVAGRAGVVIALELLGLIGIAAVGMVVQLNDGYSDKGGRTVEDVPCPPDFFLHAHAVWHVFSAAALLLTYDTFAQLQRVKDTEPDLPVVSLARQLVRREWLRVRGAVAIGRNVGTSERYGRKLRTH